MSQASKLLNEGTFSVLRKALDDKEVSSIALTEEALSRCRADSNSTNSIITICTDLALEQAKEADQRLNQGEKKPLLGIPIIVKDLILVKNYLTTAASKMLSNFTAPYDATVVTRLKQSGAPIVAKSNLDEFAMGSSNESSFYGACKNPWDNTRVAGGSSGGSAAAVANRLSSLSLGTDTGGSIRQPSALCGITGHKPTYGRVSRYGVIAFASSLDQVGPMCVDALSCSAVLDSIGGHDFYDATSTQESLDDTFPRVSAFASKASLKGIRIGRVKEFEESEIEEETRKACKEAFMFFESKGAQVVDISLPHISYSLSCYYILCTAEASSNLARYDGVKYGHRSTNSNNTLIDLYEQSRAEGFGSEVKRRILLGTFVLSSGYYDAYFEKAAKVRRLISQDFASAFKQVDVIAGPTSPFTAFALGSKNQDPLSLYAADVFTLATNLAGIPATSFGIGWDSSKLPIGFQIQAPRWMDQTSLGLAAFYQKHHPQNLKGVTT